MPVRKIYETCDRAVADILDGSTIMIGGFGSFGGLPIHLIVALAKQGLVLREVAPAWTAEEVQALTEPNLIIGEDLKEIEL